MITPQTYSEFAVRFFRGEFGGQRYGQAFLNTFPEFDDIYNKAMQELWNTPDKARAGVIIWTHCIDCSVPEPHSQED
jgi:hypothetical protein